MNKSEFGERLIEYRGRCEWSQSELAEIMGVHRNTIASWESGTIPSRGVVLRLADELSLSNAERNNFLKAAGFSDKQWPAKYWNVPYRRNPYFIGRETELQSLRQRLVSGTKTTAFVQSISGLGGVGKTQIAVEYAHRYGEYYEAVLWISADFPEVATAAWLQLATQELGLPEQQEAEQQIAAVKRWLQKRHGWLLIFDNVDDPQEILSTFIPSKHQGSVLITTRKRESGALAQNEVLPLFAEDDAVLFLLRRAKCIAMKASATEATLEAVALAKNLCQLLGRLPLALDQAGAYIAENGGSFQRYIDLYHLYRPKLLARRNANDQRDPRNKSDHPASVFVTFSLSWQQIQERNLLASKALQFCAFLAPDQIPEQLVSDGIASLETEGVKDGLEVDEALGLLYRYSLIERTDHMLSLHRLVQEVMREVLSEEEQQPWMEQAVLVVNAVFPSGEYGTWPLCEALLPHALMCAKWILSLRQKKLEGARLLNATGQYLHERAQYEEAELLLERALAIVEEQLGANHPDTARSLNNLAALYDTQGKYEEAESLYRRALAIREEQLGANHPDTASSLNNLAALYKNQGKYEEAESLVKRALAIVEEQLGANHPDTARSLNNLALLYENQGKYEEAESLVKQALAIREEQLGANHPDTASSLNNLAALYDTQRKYEEAEPLYRRALAIVEEQLGANHLDTALNLNNLAALYDAQRKYEEAEPLYRRALAIVEEQLGANHPNTALSLNNLALLYKNQGKYEEAEPLYRRAVKVSSLSLGMDHPQTQQIIMNCLTLLSDRYSNGNMDALLQLLAQKERNDNDDRMASQE